MPVLISLGGRLGLNELQAALVVPLGGELAVLGQRRGLLVLVAGQHHVRLLRDVGGPVVDVAGLDHLNQQLRS